MSYQVNANNRIYTIINDIQSSYQVLVSGEVKDELTGEAPTGELEISLQNVNEAIKKLVFIKTLEGGLFCLAGEVSHVFPHLNAKAYSLDLQIRVPGYIDVPRTVNFPQNSSFPRPPETIQMQRLPVRIQGRVVAPTMKVSAISGARLRFVDEPNPPVVLSEHVTALRAPLSIDHAQGTVVRQRKFNAVGAAKQLLASASLGSQTLMLSDLAGLSLNDVLLTGTDAAGEYVVIESFSSNVNRQILLHSPLNRSYPAGTPIQKYAVGASGTATKLTRQAIAGDGVLFLEDLLQAVPGSPAPLPNELPVDTIEIADAAAASVEYNALGAITDVDGYYRLDGINRVRTVYLDASKTGFAKMASPTACTIDNTQSINDVDFRLFP